MATKKVQLKTPTQLIGQALMRYRLNNAVSQERFAEDIHMHRTYYSALERGEKNLTIATLVKVAGAHGVSLEELFHDAGL